ncbi:MAG: SRPBCC family protein [Bacteroidales bacterium]|nr:SRPBCC family protein [Bacteroidales bacterium]MBN2763981.1 SRPBCC family protein [Bacteroidales bacterium]
MRIESRVGKIRDNEDKIFTFLSDLNNLEPLVPKEKLTSWEFNRDNCKLGIAGLGEIELIVIEREPHNLIKLGSGHDSPYSFTLWIQLKQTAEADTRTRLTLDADLNPFLQMMAQKPLQQFIDTLVEQMGKIKFS